jgi:hypothetical protein
MDLDGVLDALLRVVFAANSRSELRTGRRGGVSVRAR